MGRVRAAARRGAGNVVLRRLWSRLSACLLITFGLALGVTGVTQAPALASVRAVMTPAATPVTSVSVTPSTTAAGASEVDYTVAFTATTALLPNQGTVTLSLPAGSTFAGQVSFNDLSGP